MNPRKAAETLGLDIASATEEEVKTAAARAMAAAHPDGGGDVDLAAGQIALAKQARDTLVRHLQSDQPQGKRECPLCKGVGQLKVRGNFKAPDCPRCKGTGYVDL